jgi:hypothetical protein
MIAQEMGLLECFFTVLRIGKGWYATCRRHVNSRTNPVHKSTGCPSPTSKMFKQQIEPHLQSFFEDYLKTMAGPRATRFVREATGVSTRDDNIEILELDPECR